MIRVGARIRWFCAACGEQHEGTVLAFDEFGALARLDDGRFVGSVPHTILEVL